MKKPTPIACAGMLLLAAAGPLSAGDDWSVDWYTIDSGGVIEVDDGNDPPQWRLSGTIGQWDATEARALAAGQWRLTGGFWAIRLGEGEVDVIFRDEFAPVETDPESLLNDTGIDWCANGSNNNLDCDSPVVADYPGQDGMHGRDALAREGELDKVGGGAAGFDFTKLDDNGDELPSTAAEWSCVRDNHTGLIWEVKVNDIDHLRHKGHTYTWYNPDDSSNGGDAGVQDGGNCTGSSCDTTGFVQAINNAELCGADDWRMPSLNELHSIVDYGRTGPTIDQDYFPNADSSFLWSNTPDAIQDLNRAKGVGFETGNGYAAGRGFQTPVRLTRAGQ